jgi:DNA-binding GntR family transcriptional regulator
LDRVTNCLGFHPQLLEADPFALIDTRIVIETGVLPHVARRMKDDATIHERLSAINRELAQARTLVRFVELDIQFHRGLIECSGLTPLIPFADVLTVFFRRFRESVKKAEWSRGIAAHQDIIDALQAGRVERASDLLHAHIVSHKKRIQQPET